MSISTIPHRVDLDDFEAIELTFDDVAKRVWTTGEGPAVIVMTEMAGDKPACVALRTMGARCRFFRVASFVVWARRRDTDRRGRRASVSRSLRLR